jgi:molybdate transport system substrate-binding protein
MNSISITAASVLAAALLMQGAARAAEIRVFASGALRGAYDPLVAQFERLTGHKVVTEYGTPAVVSKLMAGEPFDVVILSLDVEGLIKQGKVVADSRVVFGRTGVGVAILAGWPKPDFSTVDKFKRMLIDAKAIGTSGDGSSGRYVASLTERLGIADQVKPKIKSGPSGHTRELLMKREVDFVVSGLPPLVGVPNLEWLGNIPEEINSWVVFTGGVSTTAKEPDAGRALLKFLTTAEAVAAFKAQAVDPVR